MRLLNYWVWVDTPEREGSGPILIPISKLTDWEPLGWQETDNVTRLPPYWYFYTSGDYSFARPPNRHNCRKTNSLHTVKHVV